MKASETEKSLENTYNKAMENKEDTGWEEKYKQKFGLCDDDKCDCSKELAFISKVEQSAIERTKAKVEEILTPYLDYCLKQNGLPYCKNCGLDLEEVKAKLNEL